MNNNCYIEKNKFNKYVIIYKANRKKYQITNTIHPHQEFEIPIDIFGEKALSFIKRALRAYETCRIHKKEGLFAYLKINTAYNKNYR